MVGNSGFPLRGKPHLAQDPTCRPPTGIRQQYPLQFGTAPSPLGPGRVRRKPKESCPLLASKCDATRRSGLSTPRRTETARREAVVARARLGDEPASERLVLDAWNGAGQETILQTKSWTRSGTADVLGRGSGAPSDLAIIRCDLWGLGDRPFLAMQE